MKTATAPAILVGTMEAAKRLGMSWNFFDQHVRAELPVIRIASKKLYRVSDLEAWAEKQAQQG